MLLENCQEVTENPNLGENYENTISQLFGNKTGLYIIFYKKKTTLLL